MPHSKNRLLKSLPTDVIAAVRPHLKPVELKLGDIVAETGSEVQRVYFPQSGIVSLVVELSVGEMIETAMVGRDGAINAASAMDGRVSFNKAIVQLAGNAFAIEVDRIRAVTDEFKVFRSVLIRHEQVVFAQAQQSAACNASHSVEARMCRWLLRMRDISESDDLTLTQDFVAQMLGVRRPSVSIVASTLQKAGLIRYRRGNIRILDVPGLKRGTCECYDTVKSHYDRLTVA